jgi:type I restriction enzyme M protein
MSPKGGIRPHKKFSISSNRSEVLFVDYIAEHLNPKGKAGIIVPEGVIFQSGTAYKQLRKMLVEKYLYAVVSLPGGVFNPYSGVKTSILLMNKELAKKKDDILFVKINNDGYGLGAQRNEIKGGQLEEAVEVLQEFKEGNFLESRIAHAVAKKEIGKNGDYNLSGGRYKKLIPINSTWPLIDLKDVSTVLNGYAFKADLFNTEKVGMPIIRIRDVNTGFSETYYDGSYDEKYIVDNEDLLIGMDGDFKATLWNNGKALLNQRVCKITNFKNVKKELIFYLIQRKLDEIHERTFAVTVKHLSSKQIESIKIPLPPLSIQEE